MAIKKSAWAAFPHDRKAFDYAGDKLKKSWNSLHGGDGEPFPDEKRAAALIKAAGKQAPKGTDAVALAEALQGAWRAFHAGDFQQAFETGSALGPIGASVAVKSLGIHATYLVEDESLQLDRFQSGVALAESAKAALPGEANSHYRHAFALGRYSQRINIAKALKMGLAGKVRQSLDEAIRLDGKHAEARTALALYHAEIIGKVGALIGGMTYGAKSAEAEKQIQLALKLAPSSPIAHVEHANLLLLLFGDKKEDAAAAAYEKASKIKPLDAMERLDVEFARGQIE